jgi:hypothetical protein
VLDNHREGNHQHKARRSMTTPIEARRTFRTKVMNWIFDEADGSESVLVSFGDFPHEDASDETAARRRLEDALAYLEGEYLLKVNRVLSGVSSVQLTHAGIVEIEQARTKPDQPTEHFTPMVNVNNFHGNVIGSQIQQGSSNATQTGTFSITQRDAVKSFIHSAREAAEDPRLDGDDRRKVLGDLDFMESELARSEPRLERLKAIGGGVKTVLLSGLGGALGRGISELPWHAAIEAFPG